MPPRRATTRRWRAPSSARSAPGSTRAHGSAWSGSSSARSRGRRSTRRHRPGRRRELPGARRRRPGAALRARLPGRPARARAASFASSDRARPAACGLGRSARPAGERARLPAHLSRTAGSSSCPAGATASSTRPCVTSLVARFVAAGSTRRPRRVVRAAPAAGAVCDRLTGGAAARAAILRGRCGGSQPMRRRRRVVAVLGAGAPPGGAGCGRGAPARARAATPAYTSSVEQAVASKHDLWGGRLLRASGGPTYAAARRFLTPLRRACSGRGGR